MATNTPNYNLAKPAGSDVPDIAVLNGNMDKLDAQLKLLNDAVQGLQTNVGLLDGHGALASDTDLNSVDSGTWALLSSRTYGNAPAFGQDAVLAVYRTSFGSILAQVIYADTGIRTRMRRGSLPGTWTLWRRIDGVV